MELVYVDVCGEFCPIPIMKAQEVYKTLSKEDQMIIITDDETVLYNLMDWLEDLGYEPNPLEKEKSLWHLKVTK